MMVTFGRVWTGGLLALMGMTHFLVWTSRSCIEVSGDPWTFVRHVQWIAITWQLDTALTAGYITFSKGFMWFSLQLDPGDLIPGTILGDPQWACNYQPLGWNPTPTEWAFNDRPSEELESELKNQRMSGMAARLLIGTSVTSFLVVVIFCCTRVIIARLVLCSTRRPKPESDEAKDVPAEIDETAKELAAEPEDAGEKEEVQNHDDAGKEAGDKTVRRELPASPIENEDKEIIKETKPPELIDGLRVLVEKAQMAIQSPFLAVQALFQGQDTAAESVTNKDTNKDAGNDESGGHDVGESAPGPESGSEAERGNVEGPDEAGPEEVGNGEAVVDVDADAEAGGARIADASAQSGPGQTVHGTDFGNPVKESMEEGPMKESMDEDPKKPTEETPEPNDAEQAEIAEADGCPPNLQFPKWEIPAFLLLFIGIPNSCGRVVASAAYFGGCSTLYASVASLVPLLMFVGFVVYAVAATVGVSGPMMWRPSSVTVALAKLRTVWGGSNLVRKNALAAVVEAASSQGYWVQRHDTELDWSVSVHFVLFIRSPEGLAAASSAENIEGFFEIARNSLRLYLTKKVGPVFRSSEKVKKDLSENDVAELVGTWLEVCIAAIWPSLEAHYIQAIRNGRADEPSLPAAAVESAKALLQVRASEYKVVLRGEGSNKGVNRLRSTFWRYNGSSAVQQQWLAVSCVLTMAMAFLMGVLKGRAQLGVQVILHTLMALAVVALLPMRSRSANFKWLFSETLRTFAIFLAALQAQGNSRVLGVAGLKTNAAALEATLIIVAIVIAVIETISPLVGCLRALVALAFGICVDPSQLPASVSYADPDRHGFRTPKRILRHSGPEKTKNMQSDPETEAFDAALIARAGAIHKWVSVRLMPAILASASSTAIAFCLDHVPSEASLEDMCDCEEVEEYLIRAREAFSQAIILAVGGIISGSVDKEQDSPANEKSGPDIERPPPFPPWLGQDGVRCVQAVMQQQVLELIQHMWKVAAEPAVRGQLLAGVAAVSLAPPSADGVSEPASVTTQWDRGLLEQNWGENASRGFGVTEEDLHQLWLGSKKDGEARFTKELILKWLKDSSSSPVAGASENPSASNGLANGAQENRRGVWC